jgi:hypothetical protein
MMVLGFFAVRSCRSEDHEHARIRLRYEAMQTAMRNRDTNAARLLFAPEHRKGADSNFARYHMFAKPLGIRSKISVDGSTANVCPVRAIPIGMFGHTIEMIKIDGEWYFTGRIGIL